MGPPRATAVWVRMVYREHTSGDAQKAAFLYQFIGVLVNVVIYSLHTSEKEKKRHFHINPLFVVNVVIASCIRKGEKRHFNMSP